jgi:hypothetical protein
VGRAETFARKEKAAIWRQRPFEEIIPAVT